MKSPAAWRGMVALTGGTGFIGRHAIRALLEQGWWVRALVRDENRLRRALQSIGVDMNACCTKLDFVVADMADEAALARLLEGADAVLHIAGLVKARRAEDFLQANAEAARRLALLAADAGSGRFVHVSSLAAREPHLSTYARSKREGEEAVLSALGQRAVAVRPPAVYGPGDEATFGLIDQLSRPLAFVPGRADMRVSLIHVRDLAAALAVLVEDVRAGAGEVLEVDDGKPGGYTWEDMRRMAEEVLRRRVRLCLLPRPLVSGAAHVADRLAGLLGRAFMLSREKVNELYHHDWVARPPLVQEHTDWTPAVQFAEGFADTLRWWCMQGRLPRGRLPGGGGNRELRA